jgi:hypothetical protein
MSRAIERSKHKRESDIARASELYCKGVSQLAIGEQLGISQSCVAKDLKILRGRWLEAGLRDFDELRSEQLAKIDALEATYWEAWNKSCRDKKRQTAGTRESARDDIKHAEIVTEGRDGNPAFLAGVDKCIERRCKLLGLDAPQRMEVNDTTPPKYDLSKLTPEELDDLQEKVKRIEA